jgi:hypothetical protein
LSNSLLTIKTKRLIADGDSAPEDTFIFKFADAKEAREWREALETHFLPSI